ncbi:hypothetical protein GCM10011371_02520 [Novosphingobium marinum]|uniref:Uncharacterized protein n=1 Tax=Novosphingobium marinum TaxID=1514948 RepID=A0A7Y9XVI6_9SPHN|nr:hypothetical protein [Novosphingobium marinum]NYH93943.1 hypothetical protein [Novosphingobium marinum]GGC18473.1 hypothetical protein GCM10011371_02520 [Novosphingobium marinum]
MAEERITTTETGGRSPDTTHTTVIQERAPDNRSGSGWLIGIVLLIAVVAGIFIFSQMGGAEAAKDNAIADAASDVGDAAGQIGEAAGDVGQAAKDAADNVSE